METSKQKFEKEALSQMKRLKEIKNVITSKKVNQIGKIYKLYFYMIVHNSNVI